MEKTHIIFIEHENSNNNSDLMGNIRIFPDVSDPNGFIPARGVLPGEIWGFHSDYSGKNIIASVIFEKNEHDDNYSVKSTKSFNGDVIFAIYSDFQRKYCCSISSGFSGLSSLIEHICAGFGLCRTKSGWKLTRTYDNFLILSGIFVDFSGEIFGKFVVKLFDGVAKIGELDCEYHNGQYLYIRSMEITEKFRKKGLGSVLSGIVINLSEYTKIPVKLESLKTAEGFHRKNGFISDLSGFVTDIIPMVRFCGSAGFAGVSKL